MKFLALAVVLFVVGYGLGKWGPTADLMRVRAELDEALKNRPAASRSPRGDGMGGVGRLLNIEPTSKPPASPNADTNQVAVAEAEDGEGTRRRRDRPRTREEFREELERARSLWQTRVDLARASYLYNVGETPEIARDFDVLMTAMNLRIGHEIDTWVAAVQDREDLRAEDMARLFHTLSGAVVSTYDEMDRKMPEGWREKAGNEFKLYDYVDPSVGEKFIDIQDRMEAARGTFE